MTGQPKRLKPLSFRQATNCETAREPKCVCRCGGKLHGAARGDRGLLDSRRFYEDLPASDPHHIPSEAERQELRRLRAYRASLRRSKVLYGSVWSADDEKDLAETERRLATIEAVVLGDLLEAHG